MSQEDVEIVRRFVERFNQAGEFVWEEMDPGVVWLVDPPACLAVRRTKRCSKSAGERGDQRQGACRSPS
jgi:hypothetical protein